MSNTRECKVFEVVRMLVLLPFLDCIRKNLYQILILNYIIMYFVKIGLTSIMTASHWVNVTYYIDG